MTVVQKTDHQAMMALNRCVMKPSNSSVDRSSRNDCDEIGISCSTCFMTQETIFLNANVFSVVVRPIARSSGRELRAHGKPVPIRLDPSACLTGRGYSQYPSGPIHPVSTATLPDAEIVSLSNRDESHCPLFCRIFKLH